MATINLPDTTGEPTDGSFKYTFEGITFIWDGDKWITEAGGSSGGASVSVLPNPPTNPGDGDLWYNTSDGRMYIYYDDGNTSQWVDSSPNLDSTGNVKLDDEGTAQAITGGGGLSIEFGTDVAQLGNIAPLNDWSVYPARS